MRRFQLNRLGWRRPALAVAVALVVAGVLVWLRRRRSTDWRRVRDDDTAWWADRCRGPARPRYRGMDVSSFYLTMRDGVRIAVDLYLPRGLEEGARIPAIVFQTRYHRAIRFRWPFGFFFRYLPLPFSATFRTIRRFVTGGYAWVAIDARGSGASFGWRRQELSPEEVQDGVEVVDWIVAQPWSDGNVGATGVSYEGIISEFVAAAGHPAVKAVAPRLALFDSFADLGFPGGIHHRHFTEQWGRINSLLDADRLHELAGWVGPLLGLGVLPVGDDLELLLEAVDEHAANYNLHSEALEIAYRDDRTASGLTVDGMSTWVYADDLQASGMPVYSYSGWFDSAFVRSAINRYLTVRTPGSRLTIGPWPHNIVQNSSPYAAGQRTRFDHDGELLRFFDYHLRGIDTGIAEEPPIHYFTVGADTWRSACCWPPPAQTLTCYLGEGHGLTTERPCCSCAYDAYRVDPEAGTGKHSRWDPLVEGSSVHYRDRAEADRRLLVYTSAPLEGDSEVTGHPLVTLYVSSTAGDGTFFVYLEDVDPRGRVVYVTEGELRALHRKLSDEPPPYRTPVPYRSFNRADAWPLVPGEVAELTFDLLPISYLFRRGHRIRLAIAGADRDHFATVPDDPPLLHVHHDAEYPSRIELPVIGGGAFQAL